MKIHLITYFNAFNIIRRKVRAYKGHIYVNLFPISHYTGFFFTFGYKWMLVFIYFINFKLPIISNDICRNSLRIMWLTNGWEVENELHFVARNIKQLCTLR
ncbi:hypothetical protein D9M68_789640 [compost metagenome]